MKCKDVMTKNISTCFKNTTIREVAKIMRDKYIGMIPIVYEDTGFVAGLITDRDIVTRVIAYDKSVDDKVCNFMKTMIYRLELRKWLIIRLKELLF